MRRARREPDPLKVERIVESEHRAGVDLAWIVVATVVLCILAIAFRIPQRTVEGLREVSELNLDGIVALVVVVPLGAGLFAWRRYRDAVGAQKELTHLTLHDALTGLPNRRHLREVLPRACEHARRANTRAAVLFIDLDGFKAVNDTYGHEVGDRVMAAVAQRLRAAAGESRFAARYAGDEFVIVDPEPVAAESSVRFGQQLVELVEQPFEFGQDRISVSASVGVVMADGTADPDQIVHDADTAMYDAKAVGGRVALFEEAMRARLTPATAERRLARALEEGEFRLLFQPIVALRTSRLVGAEALLRWEDPERGLVRPAEFLPALEETGLVVPVGRWVLGEACRQARRWAEMTPPGGTPLRVTTNVSPRELAQTDFVDGLRAALGESGVDPGLLYIELTETALVADVRAAWASLRAARELGVGLALDDFGTGYSSLSHLRTFDLDLLKLDRSFVVGLGEHGVDEALVGHVLSLARTLRIATLAEGIGDAAQVEHLLRLGCELGQGNHFAEPQPASVIDALVARTNVVAPAASTAEAGTVVAAELREAGSG